MIHWDGLPRWFTKVIHWDGFSEMIAKMICWDDCQDDLLRWFAEMIQQGISLRRFLWGDSLRFAEMNCLDVYPDMICWYDSPRWEMIAKMISWDDLLMRWFARCFAEINCWDIMPRCFVEMIGVDGFPRCCCCVGWPRGVAKMFRWNDLPRCFPEIICWNDSPKWFAEMICRDGSFARCFAENIHRDGSPRYFVEMTHGDDLPRCLSWDGLLRWFTQVICWYD